MAPKTDLFELWGSLFDLFFTSHFASIFSWFFIDFWKPKLWKISIFPRENHDFYRIGAFAMETKFHRKMTSQTLRFGSQNHQKTPKNQLKKHSKKQLIFKTLLFGFWEGFGIPGFECWACFCLPKSIFFALFSKFQFLIDSGAFWEGLGRVWGGFGESFGRVWGGFGEVWRGFGKILGMKFSSHWRNEGRPADCALRS